MVLFRKKIIYLSIIAITNKFILLLGADNIVNFENWKAYNEILENHELYIYPRKISDPIPNYFINHRKIYWMNAPLIDASSTDIRNKIKNKKSIRNLVPKNVCYSILEKKLENDKQKILMYFDNAKKSVKLKDQKDIITFKKALYLLQENETDKAKSLLKNLIKNLLKVMQSKFKFLIKFHKIFIYTQKILYYYCSFFNLIF